MRVDFAAAARYDLQQIAIYISRDSPRRAKTYVAELRDRCFALADQPFSGVLRAQIDETLHLIPYGNYNIYYRVREAIEVLRIVHSARHIDEGDL